MNLDVTGVKTHFSLPGLSELTEEELRNTNAGGEWWFWLGKTAKKTYDFLMDLAEASKEQYHMGMM